MPPGFDVSGDVEAFMARLPEADGWFRDQFAVAQRDGKVLRYVGSIEGGKCKVAIKAVGADEPLFKVKDGENALAFFSTYYQPIPLVLRGYGAGTEVTAAGVFADVLRTELEAGVVSMSSDMYQSGSVVAYAPASSANLSVGFDVLGAALAPWMAPCSGIASRSRR